ncbi:troponin [Anaeramoeba flamelloides]|uniref:Troponin n=1 Tax=Anaeramoeba flamelloides TaxID=1746091 RepID=A0AAV7YYW9_9EUKA|nr:troponin [Anaeramoeba flamelloides]
MNIQEQFKKYDTNNDGFIQPEELKKGLQLEEEEVTKIYKEFDKNSDGKLDFFEFKYMMLKREFDLFDKNNDGKLELNELMEGYNLEEEAAKKIIAKYDTNNDGVLQFCEFKKWKHDVFIKNEFNHYDTNNDGFIQPDELKTGYKLEEDVVTKIYKEFDTNSDGKLDFDEFFKWKVSEEFKELDKNNDGKLDKEEIMAGFRCDEECAKKFIVKYDKDNDGSIDLNEWYGVYKL